MDPIGFQQVDQKNDGAAGPGDGISPGDGGQFIDVLDGDGDIADPEDAPAQQHGDHGDCGFSRTPENAGGAVGEGQQTVEQADGPHMPAAKGHHIRLAIEKPDQLRCKDVGNDTNGLRHQDAAGDSKVHTLLYPVVLSGAQILSDKGGQGHGETGDGQKREALDLGIGAAARHGGSAEAVDIGLDHQIGNADDGVLNTGGKTESHDGFQAAGIKPDGPDMHFVCFFGSQQLTETKQRADTLGDGGGQCRCSNPQMEYRHKQQIQYHIHQCGEYQIIQRMAAVAYGVENPHENVEHHGKHGAAEIEAEIEDGQGEYVRRCVHPAQDGGREGNAEDRQKSACHQPQRHIGVDGGGHLPVLLCAEIPGDDDAGAHGQALEKADQHVDQISRGAHRSQSGIAHKFTNHPGIEGIVKLLEHIAQQDRQGEHQNFLPDNAFGQIIAVRFHESPLPFQKSCTRNNIIMRLLEEKVNTVSGIFLKNRAS